MPHIAPSTQVTELYCCSVTKWHNGAASVGVLYKTMHRDAEAMAYQGNEVYWMPVNPLLWKKLVLSTMLQAMCVFRDSSVLTAQHSAYLEWSVYTPLQGGKGETSY